MDKADFPGKHDMFPNNGSLYENAHAKRKEQKMKHLKRKFITLLTVACMLCTMSAPAFGAENSNVSKPSSPRIKGDTVTWDCVYFGSYPQSEVDYSKDEQLYDTLEKASNWDINNDMEVAGNRYHRVPFTSSSDYYDYYKYEPIKWRVLSVNGNEALLLAEKGLDSKPYNETRDFVTWETSTIRSWLNGYGSDVNKDRKDYSSDSFIGKAFTSDEREGIYKKNLKNPDNTVYDEIIEGGNDTEDQIFLLSLEEATNEVYGFANHEDTTTTRRAMSTDYADTLAWWWLRSPGSDSASAAFVRDDGAVSRDGYDIDSNSDAVRPALWLNLNSTLWSGAGTEEGNKNSKGIDHITASKSKTTYKVGERLNLDDLTVTVVHNDGSRRPVTNYTTDANTIDMMTPGYKYLTITYTEGRKWEDSILITVEQQTVNPGPSNSGSGSGSTTTAPNNNGDSKPAGTTAKPKTATLKKVSSTKKGTLKLTWKKDAKVTGYQAMVATDKKFKKNKKTATIKKNKNVSKTFNKLKSKKTYFAKVRSYKQVGKTKVYGAYSKVKKAKVK